MDWEFSVAFTNFAKLWWYLASAAIKWLNTMVKSTFSLKYPLIICVLGHSSFTISMKWFPECLAFEPSLSPFVFRYYSRYLKSDSQSSRSNLMTFLFLLSSFFIYPLLTFIYPDDICFSYWTISDKICEQSLYSSFSKMLRTLFSLTFTKPIKEVFPRSI